MESAAGILVGAKTGLSACVAGSLFLLTASWTPIATFFNDVTASPAIMVSCFLIIQCIQFIDFRVSITFIPSLISFALIPMFASVAYGATVSHFLYFVSSLFFAPSRNRIYEFPQQIVLFYVSVLFIPTYLGDVNNESILYLFVVIVSLSVATVAFFLIKNYCISTTKAVDPPKQVREPRASNVLTAMQDSAGTGFVDSVYRFNSNLGENKPDSSNRSSVGPIIQGDTFFQVMNRRNLTVKPKQNKHERALI